MVILMISKNLKIKLDYYIVYGSISIKKKKPMGGIS
jgi:hypothetical protein